MHYVDTFTNARTENDEVLSSFMETRYHYSMLNNFVRKAEYYIQEVEVNETAVDFQLLHTILQYFVPIEEKINN